MKTSALGLLASKQKLPLFFFLRFQPTETHYLTLTTPAVYRPRIHTDMTFITNNNYFSAFLHRRLFGDNPKSIALFSGYWDEFTVELACLVK